MKKFLKEIIILIIQICMFYIFPLFAGPTDALGMVFIILLSTLLLSIFMGLSNNKFKYLYPIMVAIIFIPSIWIYYNSSALIHSIWYLIISIIGLLVGIIISNTIITIKNNTTNKYYKKILIAIGIIFGIIILDSIQALIFENNPVIGIYKENIKKGIIVDTYNCSNNKRDTVIKGFSYSCSYSNVNFILIDKTKEIKDFSCLEVLESFYEDEEYTYYWNCMKNDYMIVRYDNGSITTISKALKEKRIEIEILEKFDIKYIKEVK